MTIVKVYLHSESDTSSFVLSSLPSLYSPLVSFIKKAKTTSLPLIKPCLRFFSEQTKFCIGVWHELKNSTSTIVKRHLFLSSMGNFIGFAHEVRIAHTKTCMTLTTVGLIWIEKEPY